MGGKIREELSRELAAIDDMVEIITGRCVHDRITDAMLREILEATENMKGLLADAGVTA